MCLGAASSPVQMERPERCSQLMLSRSPLGSMPSRVRQNISLREHPSQWAPHPSKESASTTSNVFRRPQTLHVLSLTRCETKSSLRTWYQQLLCSKLVEGIWLLSLLNDSQISSNEGSGIAELLLGWMESLHLVRDVAH